MASNKSVIMSLLGNNRPARESIQQVKEDLDLLHTKAEEPVPIDLEAEGAEVQVNTLAASLEKYKIEATQAAEATARLKEMQASGKASAAELAAAEDAVAKTAKAAKAAQLELGRAELASGDAASVAAARQEELVFKTSAGNKAAFNSEKAWGVAKLAILGIGAGLVYGAAKAIGFNQQIEHLHTQAGLSIPMMNQLSNGVLKLAGQVGQNPDSLAEAAYHVASNMGAMGATSTQMLEAVKVAAQGASVGGANLVDVTNTLGAAIASGMKGTEDYTKAMGALNATVGAGDMSMQDLAEAMGGGALANAKLYGASLNDVSAILATFGDNNIRGAEAGTQMRMSIQSIAVQAHTAGPFLEKLGLHVGELGKYQSLHGTVATLDLLSARMKAAGITSAEQGNVITQLFGKKAGAGIGVLLDQIDRVNDKAKVAAEGAKGFGAAWTAQSNTPAQKLKNLEAGSEALAISLGAHLLPAANVILGWLDKFVVGLEKGSLGATTIAGILGTVLGAIALGKLTEGIKGTVDSLETMWHAGAKVAQGIGTLIGKLFAQTAATEGAEGAQAGLNLTMLMNPIALIIIAIIALVAGFIYLWKHSAAFRDFWKAVWHDILVAVDFVWNWVKHNWPYLLGMLVGPIGLAAVYIIKHWDSIENGAKKVLSAVIGFFKRLPGEIISALGDLGKLLWNAGKSIVQGLIDGVKAMVSPLTSVFSGITNLIPSWKGPPSKDRVLLHDNGKLIMQSLIDGLDHGMPGLKAQLTRTTNVIASTHPTMGAGRGRAGGADLTVEWIGGNGGDREFISWLKKQIRIRGGNPDVLGR